MAKRQITKKSVAQCIGKSEKALSNRLSGAVDFTWPETCAIKNTFFPDMDKDALFAKADGKEAS